MIASLLPNKPPGVPRVDDRRVLKGIFWVLRPWALWRDLPERYGPYTTCYNRFNHCRKVGVFDRLMDAVINACHGDIQMINSSVLRVHQHATSLKKRDRVHCMGRSRGGLSTKSQGFTDARGLPIRLALTPGQRHASLVADCIPDVATRKYRHCFSEALYRERNQNERFFSPTKHFRRIATRFEKHAAKYLATIKLAAVRNWLRTYEPMT